MEIPHFTDRVSTGIKGLDIMTGNGVIRGTSTLVTGGSGTGKTTIGTQFIAEGARAEEPGMIVSFIESEEQALTNASSIGHDIRDLVSSGAIKVVCTSMSALEAGEHAIQLRTIIKKENIKRIFVDDVNVFSDLMTPLDAKDHIKLLSEMFRSNGVTSMFAQRPDTINGMHYIEDYGMDTSVLLSLKEEEDHIDKTITVMKMHRSHHDKGIRKFEIRDTGVDIMLPSSD